MSKATYRVNGKEHRTLADARADAERIMAGMHDDDYVMIQRKDGEDFFEPYASVERRNGKFVLRR